MFGLRQKVFIWEIFIFLLFVLMIFPFGDQTVGRMVRRSCITRTKKLIERLKAMPDLDAIFQQIQTNEHFILQRVTLTDHRGQYLYDTKETQKEIEERHPAIEQALRGKSGYGERYSESLQGMVAYFAVPFEFKGKTYVFRIGYPLEDLQNFQSNISVSFLFLGMFLLTIYGIMNWLAIHRLIRPVQKINNAILSYQEGKEEFLPRIHLSQSMGRGEFNKLAFTFNALIERIQKQIEHLTQQREETEGVLESLGEGVVAFDTSGKITFVNQVACRMLGTTHLAMMGQFLNAVPSRYSELIQKGHEFVLQVLQTSEPIAETWTHIDESRIYLDLTAAPLAKHHGAILVLQDKSSDYKMLQMGKDFIANASHELRTPITIIRGFAEMLQDLSKLSQETVREIVGKIVRTCGRLDQLVKSLLTLADIENLSEKRFCHTDLLSLAEHCNHLFLTAHPGVKVAFHNSFLRSPIFADPALIDLAIMNLLENAVKYSPAPAHIDLSITHDKQEVYLHIKDKGIGIPAADLPYIFDRFYTVDKARSRKSGGAGLGLSIVKTIIEKHRGRITVISEPSKGSTFTIALPLKPAM